MGTQHEVTSNQKLLNKYGNIAEPGFAYSQVWQYDRKDIKAPKWRIKEWAEAIASARLVITAISFRCQMPGRLSRQRCSIRCEGSRTL